MVPCNCCGNFVSNCNVPAVAGIKITIYRQHSTTAGGYWTRYKPHDRLDNLAAQTCRGRHRENSPTDDFSGTPEMIQSQGGVPSLCVGVGADINCSVNLIL